MGKWNKRDKFNLEESDTTPVDENGETSDNSNRNINDVINSFNLVIEWAKERNLPCNEVLLFVTENKRKSDHEQI